MQPSCSIAFVLAALMSLSDAQLPLTARGVPCLKDVGFYRRASNGIDQWDPLQLCTEYFECLNGKVIRYDCGKMRRFNVVSGQCDYRKNVNATNCAITSKTPRPAFDKAGCPAGQLGCSNKMCLNVDKFCNGLPDCPDGSDEAYCSIDDDPNAAPVCDETKCQLPNCFCSPSGTKIPGGLAPAQTPQMVLLSFDDAVNANVLPIYEALFSANLTNPNGCPIRATFYLSHQWTDYRLVQKLYKSGHDFGLHSVSHKQPESYWDTGDILKKYGDEFVTNQKMATAYGQLPGADYFKVMRVPWLKLGGNRQVQFMRANNILIDHTISAPPGKDKFWPYTLDYRMPHKCYSSNDQSCPTRKFPGSWVFPINQINGSLNDGPAKGQYYCSMMESCPARDFDAMLSLLRTNFKSHYEGNRAPFGLFFHARWFIDEGHFPALQQWITETLSQTKDVFFVTTYQELNWILNPQPLGSKLSAFDCPSRDSVPNVCSADESACGELPPINSASPSAYFNTCRLGVGKCPQFYPWIGNWQGQQNTYDAGVSTSAPLTTTQASA